MENTLRIEVINQRAFRLLYELEALDLIKVLRKTNTSSTKKLSEKYKNVFSKEEADSFRKHTKKMREEWNNT